MDNLFQKLFFRSHSKKIGLLKYQEFFEETLELSLRGMNIGEGGDFNKSGEIKVLKYIKEKLDKKKKLYLFDVGANLGNYSLCLTNVFKNSDYYLFSFEPSRETFRELCKVCAGNRVKNYNFGFGEKESKTFLHSNEKGSGLASVHKRRLDHFNIDMKLKEEIEIKTIDQFCLEKNIVSIAFLKLDVEGNELNVLRGAKRMLEKGAIKFIQFEFGGCNIDSRTFFQDFYYLLKDNYRIYRIVKDGLREIKNYKECYELFITTNFLAEIK